MDDAQDNGMIDRSALVFNSADECTHEALKFEVTDGECSFFVTVLRAAAPTRKTAQRWVERWVGPKAMDDCRIVGMSVVMLAHETINIVEPPQKATE